jgi:BirA family biotin operon repressor/biotin-[acetyl-CoA-carboxylase] ligase
MLVWNHPYSHLPVAQSTNAVLKALIQEDSFLPGAVSAGEQTAGRGRGDNVWCSPTGGLYLSVALPVKEPEVLPLVGPSVAVAVTRWLRERFAVDAGIKWPNDWLVEDRKLGGLLLELVRAPRGTLAVVAGVGINVRRTPQVPNRRAFLPTSLSEWADVTNVPLEPLARELAAVVLGAGAVRAVEEPALRVAMKESSRTLGREVCVLVPGGERVSGVAVDFGPDYSLCVRTADRAVRVQAGDCFHGLVTGSSGPLNEGG